MRASVSCEGYSFNRYFSRRCPPAGAPRILRMLGFKASERTILRSRRRAPRDSRSAKRWLSFCTIIGKPSPPRTPHRSDAQVRGALLLLPHRSRSQAYLALKRYDRSDQGLHHPTVAGDLRFRLFARFARIAAMLFRWERESSGRKVGQVDIHRRLSASYPAPCNRCN
jgi:hypothetical protein